MPRHVIREVRVDPPVPPDLVVLRREDIERFVDAAYATVAKLEAELEIARIVRPAAVVQLPPWTDRPAENHVQWYESLRDADETPLIAGTA